MTADTYILTKSVFGRITRFLITKLNLTSSVMTEPELIQMGLSLLLKALLAKIIVSKQLNETCNLRSPNYSLKCIMMYVKIV